MPMPSHNRRASRAAVAALGAAGLIALAAAPAAFADETAPELVVGGVGPIDGLKPGDTFDVPVTVANKGTRAERVWVTYAVTRGLDFAEVPSNCRTQYVRPYDEMPERWTAVCAFDQAVEPGLVYTTDRPIRVKALDRALNDELRLRVGENDPGADDNGTPPVAGTAPAVKLVEGPAGGEGSAGVVDVPVTTVNTADYQVTGAALKGSVGETVPLKVDFANAGPAWFMTKLEEPSARVTITLPAGTSAVKIPGYCKAKGAAYDCGTSQRALNEGGRLTYAFELRIDKRVADAEGSVVLGSEARPSDPDEGNDRAGITLDVVGGGPTGSPGGSGGSGGGSGGGSTGGSGGSGGGSTGGSVGGSSSTGGDGATVNGGNLAETGSSALPITGVAVAAVATGAGMFVIVRRRRTESSS